MAGGNGLEDAKSAGPGSSITFGLAGGAVIARLAGKRPNDSRRGLFLIEWCAGIIRPAVPVIPKRIKNRIVAIEPARISCKAVARAGMCAMTRGSSHSGTTPTSSATSALGSQSPGEQNGGEQQRE